MDQRPTHRERLVDHFAAFTADERAELQGLYGADEPSPTALAVRFLGAAETIRELISRELGGDEDAMRLLEELAHDHDLLVDVSWSSVTGRRRLRELGLLAPRDVDAPAHHYEVPAAVAAVVAPFLRSTPMTIPTLLGAEDEEQIHRVAQTYGIGAPSPIEKVLRISEFLADPARAEDFLDYVGSPDYLGAALMVLELGGACYWQEVFGHDLDQNPEFGDNVVALMPTAERDFERHVADSLVDFGVIYRLESDGKAPLAVVPEELWSLLWTLGRSWMLEWAALGYENTIETAVRRRLEVPLVRLQGALKWFACESDDGGLAASLGKITDETVSRLAATGGHDVDFWRQRLRLGLELSALRIRKSGAVVDNPAFRRVLDLPGAAFVRQVLFDWCTGYVGAEADRRLVLALSLDEEWRQEVVRFLHKRNEFAPLWLNYTGVEPRTTGSGCIRNAGDSPEELLAMEIGLANGLVWTAKLVWLDLLSFLEGEMWYSRGDLVELLQLATGFAAFSQLIHVLEQPSAGYYLPVQRASVMSDHYQTGAFDSWFEDIVDGLFEPLGIATFSEDQESVWLETTGLRVESPPGLPDNTREQLFRELFASPELEFELPGSPASRLHTISSAAADGVIDTSRPIADIRRFLEGRRITHFDGTLIHAVPSD